MVEVPEEVQQNIWSVSSLKRCGRALVTHQDWERDRKILWLHSQIAAGFQSSSLFINPIWQAHCNVFIGQKKFKNIIDFNTSSEREAWHNQQLQQIKVSSCQQRSPTAPHYLGEIQMCSTGTQGTIPQRTEAKCSNAIKALSQQVADELYSFIVCSLCLSFYFLQSSGDFWYSRKVDIDFIQLMGKWKGESNNVDNRWVKCMKNCSVDPSPMLTVFKDGNKSLARVIRSCQDYWSTEATVSSEWEQLFRFRPGFRQESFPGQHGEVAMAWTRTFCMQMKL